MSTPSDRQIFESILSEVPQTHTSERRRLSRLFNRITHSRPADEVRTRAPAISTRAPTPEALAAARVEALDEERRHHPADDNTVALWNRITERYARGKVRSERDLFSVPDADGKGCWLSTRAPAHNTGYVKINLRNTEGIGFSPFMHQLSLIAAGRREELNLSLGRGSDLQVSHLCHTPNCFNPEHLIVEPSRLNKSRNDCKNCKIVKFMFFFSYDPCPHGQTARKRCILPIRRFTRPGQYSEPL